MAETDQTLRGIFDAALEMDDPAQRRSYLDGACGGDVSLRREVDELLAAHETVGGFLGNSQRQGANAAAARISEREGDRIGRYRLLQKIGEGGCGVVYLAEQEEPVRRRVALKIIKLGMDTRSVVARFEAERQALAMMEHPHIARVLDGGSTDTGRPYFVMELVRGIRITDYCDQHSLTTSDRLRLFAQVCHAVQHAHQKGIIHRDLKPSNILVTSQDGGPLPKIIDFGIAKATNSQQLTDKTLFTRFEMFLGTPAYMSPEQADFHSADIDTRSDIYALGVLLYELLTGRTPFDSETLLKSGIDAMRRAIRETEPVRPSTQLHAMKAGDLAEVARRRQLDPPKLVSSVRGDLDWIVLKALAKDRTRRYDTANILALDVQRHLDHQPILARPPNARDAIAKWIQRHRATMATLVSLILLLVAGATISTWQWLRARTAEHAQRELRLQAESARETAERESYFTTIGVAGKFIDEGQTERALDLLLRCPERFRHWEWGRLLLLCQTSVRALRTGQGRLKQPAFSSDNSLLATLDEQGTAKIWDLASGALLPSSAALPNNVRAAIWTPHVNDLWLLTRDGQVRVWDSAAGRARVVLPDAGLRFLSVNPKRAQVLTAGTATPAAVWNATSGEKEFELEGAKPGSVGECFFSPDGTRVIAVNQAFSHAAGTEVARVWDARNGRELERLQAPSLQWLNRWAWLSPDGRRMASIHADGSLRVWDATTGDPLFTKLSQSVAPRYAIISPDAKTVGAYYENASIRLWNLETGDELHSPTERAYHIQFTSDGRSYVTSGGALVAWVWNLAGGEPYPLRGHGAFVGLSAFSPDGRLVACAADDGVVRIWSLRAGREAVTSSDWGQQTSFSPDGRSMVTAQFDLQARVWDVETGAERLRLIGHRSVVSSAVFSPDGRRLLTGSYDRTARLWDASNGRELWALRGHTRGIQRVAISPDGRRLATASWDQTARLWQADNGREEFTIRGHRGPLRELAFSPDSLRLATASADGTARVWEAATGRESLVLSGHQGAVSATAFSPDGRWIVTGGADKTLKFWDANSGRLLRSHTARTRLHSLAFSPDGKRLFTASTEFVTSLGYPSLEVWDPQTGRELLSMPGREGVWHSVGFSPDGRRLASSGTDPLTRVREAFPWQPHPDVKTGTGTDGERDQIRSHAESYWRDRLASERRPASPDTNRLTAAALPRSLWPARDPQCPAGAVDLTAHYNGWLDVAWLPPRLLDNLDNDLGALPRGAIELGGVTFDVRGVVQLAGAAPTLTGWFPRQITNIVVGRVGQRLHLLHATTTDAPSGTLVGRYTLRFANDRRHEHDLRMHRDLGAWWGSTSQSKTDAPVVWTGDNRTAQAAKMRLRLFKLTLENPWPETPLATLDFVSEQSSSAPFLIALTVE